MKMFFNKRAIMMSTDYLNRGQVKPRLEALNVKTEYVVFGTQRRIASATLSNGPFSLFLRENPINQAQHYIPWCDNRCKS